MKDPTEPHETETSANRILIRAPKSIPATLVVKYVSRTADAVAAVEGAVERSELEPARIFGHRLRGNGGAYGIPALTEIGAAIERGAVEGDCADISRQLVLLDAYLRRIEVVVE
jgi:histidine phosphotransfer protein HptB